MKKARYIVTLAVCGAFIAALALLLPLLPDGDVSRAERRKLAQRPELSAESLFSGDYADSLETYLLDQFPGRDSWRTLAALMRFDVFREKDSNGVYLVGDNVAKVEYPLDEKQVLYGAGKINSVIDTYLRDMNVRYSIIPDKNYFMAEENGYPHMDYDRLRELMAENVNAEYVDIFGLLSAGDYYRTDAHWKQEALLPVAQALAEAFGMDEGLIPEAGFTEHTLSPFYGVYCGQSALTVTPDTLTYLTSPAIEGASMTGAEFEGSLPVYTTDRFEGMDGYDVFAAGAQAIVTIESPEAKTDRELIIFRDSFGSSIAPLFLENYRKVTLVDLRYISSQLLPDYVDFTAGQDVLFLYSTSLLNSAMLLK